MHERTVKPGCLVSVSKNITFRTSNWQNIVHYADYADAAVPIGSVLLVIDTLPLDDHVDDIDIRALAPDGTVGWIRMRWVKML